MSPTPPPPPSPPAPAAARPSLAWPQLHEGERMPRRLRWVLGAIVTMVLSLASVEYIVVENGESLRETDGEAMRLIVRQGALAERLGREGARLASGQGDGQALAQTLRTMVEEGGQLHDLRRQWDGPDTHDLTWTTQRERLWATAQSLQMALERGDRDVVAYAERLHAQADAFRAPVDAAVTLLGNAIEQRRARVQSQHARLIGLLAVMVSITVALIGEPLARHLGRQHRRLVDQGRELQRLALVADRTGRAVLIADADGRVTWTNDAYRQTTGRRPEDTLGQPLADLLAGDGTDPAAARRLVDALQAGRAARLDLVLRGAAGQPV